MPPLFNLNVDSSSLIQQFQQQGQLMAQINHQQALAKERERARMAAAISSVGETIGNTIVGLAKIEKQKGIEQQMTAANAALQETGDVGAYNAAVNLIGAKMGIKPRMLSAIRSVASRRASGAADAAAGVAQSTFDKRMATLDANQQMEDLNLSADRANGMLRQQNKMLSPLGLRGMRELDRSESKILSDSVLGDQFDSFGPDGLPNQIRSNIKQKFLRRRMKIMERDVVDIPPPKQPLQIEMKDGTIGFYDGNDGKVYKTVTPQRDKIGVGGLGLPPQITYEEAYKAAGKRAIQEKYNQDLGEYNVGLEKFLEDNPDLSKEQAKQQYYLPPPRKLDMTNSHIQLQAHYGAQRTLEQQKANKESTDIALMQERLQKEEQQIQMVAAQKVQQAQQQQLEAQMSTAQPVETPIGTVMVSPREIQQIHAAATTADVLKVDEKTFAIMLGSMNMGQLKDAIQQIVDSVDGDASKMPPELKKRMTDLLNRYEAIEKNAG